MTEKVNLKIEDFEDKKTKADKRYTRFKTSDGWMSAFGTDTIEKLKQNVGKVCCVEIAVDEASGFKNLRKFIGLATETTTQMTEPQSGIVTPAVERPGETPSKYNGQTAMYVSYAKDIFTSARGTTMEDAIALVKKAKEAFN